MTQFFWSPNETNVDRTISELKELKFDLTYKGEVDSFMGVKLDNEEDGKITISQSALIEIIIKSLGLENNSKPHQTPAVSLPLQKYKDSNPFKEQ